MKPAFLMTRKITLANGNKLKVTPPRMAYECVISSPADVTFYEKASSYAIDSVTYGEGVTGRNIAALCEEPFWISGTTSQVVYITFTCGG
jgi:hypothetical protein